MALRPPTPVTRVGKAANAAWEAVFGIGVTMALGYYADRWLGTEPVLFFVFLVLGMVIGFRRLIRLSNDGLSNDGVADEAAPLPDERDEKGSNGHDR